MTLGLNIGVISNLNNRDKIRALSYLFSSTAVFENYSTTVWDLSSDQILIKARAWDYLKIVHGKFEGDNPVDEIIYKVSNVDHFGIMGDETAIRDVNFLILDTAKQYSDIEMKTIEAYCDKFVMVSNFHANPENINLSTTLKTSRPIEIWFYSDIAQEQLIQYMEKFSAYFKGQGFEFGEIIPMHLSVAGFYTFYSKPKQSEFESEWATALTKIFYHAGK